jgi:hypothetical protein
MSAEKSQINSPLYADRFVSVVGLKGGIIVTAHEVADNITAYNLWRRGPDGDEKIIKETLSHGTPDLGTMRDILIETHIASLEDDQINSLLNAVIEEIENQ